MLATRRPLAALLGPLRRQRRRRRARETAAAAAALGGLLAGFVAAPPPAHRLTRIKFADLAGHFAVGGGGSSGAGEGEADYQQQLADSVAQHVHDGRSVGDEFDAHKKGWLLAPWLCWGSVKAPDGAPPATKGGEASAAAAAPEPHSLINKNEPTRHHHK